MHAYPGRSYNPLRVNIGFRGVPTVLPFKVWGSWRQFETAVRSCHVQHTILKALNPFAYQPRREANTDDFKFLFGGWKVSHWIRNTSLEVALLSHVKRHLQCPMVVLLKDQSVPFSLKSHPNIEGPIRAQAESTGYSLG